MLSTEREPKLSLTAYRMRLGSHGMELEMGLVCSWLAAHCCRDGWGGGWDQLGASNSGISGTKGSAAESGDGTVSSGSRLYSWKGSGLNG